MSVYVIHAYDELYGGLHGMEEWAIEECVESSQVVEMAYDMSYDVINSYSDITETLSDRAHDYVSYDIEEKPSLTLEEQDKLFEQYLDDEIREDVCYHIVKLNDKHTLEEYQAMINNGEYDYQELADEFGEEEEY